MPRLDGIEAMRRMHERVQDDPPRVLVVTTFDGLRAVDPDP